MFNKIKVKTFILIGIAILITIIIGDNRSQIVFAKQATPPDILDIALPRGFGRELPRVAQALTPNVWIDGPNTANVNEPFTVRVYISGGGTTADEAYLDASFPDGGLVSIVDKDPSLDEVKSYPPGSEIYHRNNSKIIAQDLLISAHETGFDYNEVRWFEVEITVSSTGYYDIFYRSTTVDSGTKYINPTDSSGDTDDQQGWPVFIHRINVQNPPANLEIRDWDCEYEPWTWGNLAQIDLDIYNSGGTTADTWVKIIASNDTNLWDSDDYIIFDWHVTIDPDELWTRRNYTWTLPATPYPNMPDNGRVYYYVHVGNPFDLSEYDPVNMGMPKGSLGITVHNIDGTRWGGAEVYLFTADWSQQLPGSPKLTDGNGNVIYSNIDEGDYNIEVKFTPSGQTPAATELWGSQPVTVIADQSTPVDFHRSWPTIDIREANPVVVPSSVPIGNSTSVQVKVFAAQGGSYNTRVKMMLDQDKTSPYDVPEFTCTPDFATVTNSTYTFTCNTPVLTQPGTYFLYYRIEAEAPSGWLPTDQNNWTQSFPVGTRTGDLGITVHNVDGSQWGGAEVYLFTVDWSQQLPGSPKVTDSNGSVIYSNIDEGDYNIEVKFTPSGQTPAATELWGSQSVTVVADQSTPVDFHRSWPTIDIRDPNRVIVPSGVPIGSSASIQVKVFAAQGGNYKTRVKMILDRDKMVPYDVPEFTCTPDYDTVTNSTYTFTCNTPALTQPGTYYVYYRIEAEAPSGWLATDQNNWTQSFPVGTRKGSLGITVHNVDGSRWGGAHVYLYTSDWKDQLPGSPKVTDSNGNVLYSNIDEGDYKIEVKHTPSGQTPAATELWGSQPVTVIADQSTPVDFHRSWPTIDIRETNPVVVPSSVQVGNSTSIQVKVFAPQGGFYDTRVKMILDRDKTTPYDVPEFTCTPSTAVVSNSMYSFSCDTPALTQPGTYQVYYKIEGLNDSAWVPTDQNNWQIAFPVGGLPSNPQPIINGYLSSLGLIDTIWHTISYRSHDTSQERSYEIHIVIDAFGQVSWPTPLSEYEEKIYDVYIIDTSTGERVPNDQANQILLDVENRLLLSQITDFTNNTNAAVPSAYVTGPVLRRDNSDAYYFVRSSLITNAISEKLVFRGFRGLDVPWARRKTYESVLLSLVLHQDLSESDLFEKLERQWGVNKEAITFMKVIINANEVSSEDAISSIQQLEQSVNIQIAQNNLGLAREAFEGLSHGAKIAGDVYQLVLVQSLIDSEAELRLETLETLINSNELSGQDYLLIEAINNTRQEYNSIKSNIWGGINLGLPLNLKDLEGYKSYIEAALWVVKHAKWLAHPNLKVFKASHPSKTAHSTKYPTAYMLALQGIWSSSVTLDGKLALIREADLISRLSYQMELYLNEHKAFPSLVDSEETEMLLITNNLRQYLGFMHFRRLLDAMESKGYGFLLLDVVDGLLTWFELFYPSWDEAQDDYSLQLIRNFQSFSENSPPYYLLQVNGKFEPLLRALKESEVVDEEPLPSSLILGNSESQALLFELSNQGEKIANPFYLSVSMTAGLDVVDPADSNENWQRYNIGDDIYYRDGNPNPRPSTELLYEASGTMNPGETVKLPIKVQGITSGNHRIYFRGAMLADGSPDDPINYERDPADSNFPDQQGWDSYIVDVTIGDPPIPNVSSMQDNLTMDLGSKETVYLTLSNNGGNASPAYIDVSVSEGLEIIQSLPMYAWDRYPIGSDIWRSGVCSTGPSQYLLYSSVQEMLPFSTTQLYAIIVKAIQPGNHWIKYRAAMNPEGVPPGHPGCETDTFIRDPSSGDLDQQGWNAYTIPVTIWENQPPSIADYLPNQSTITIPVDDSVNFSVTATDPDPESVLSYIWVLDDFQVLGIDDTLQWVATEEYAGKHTISVIVKDGELFSTHTWNLFVQTSTCYLLTLTHSGNGTSPISNPGKSTECSQDNYYVPGTEIMLLGAIPSDGWQIVEWLGTDNDTITLSSNTVTMPASAHTVSVNYEESAYPLVEEFDSDIEFTSTSPGQVYIQDGKVIWNLTQTVSTDQYLYRSIPYFEGDYRLTVLGQINDHLGNHNVEIGVSNAYGVGPNINFGYFGGSLGLPHCPNSGYYIGARGVSLIPDETTGCDTVPINPGTPYLVTMTIRNGVMDLEVDGVGTAHGTTTYTGPIDMLWIGQEGNVINSPWASGTIDYVIIEPLEPECYDLTITISGLGTVPVATPTNSQGCQANQYLVGEEILLEGADPDVGWHIAGWTGTINDLSTESSNTVLMPAYPYNVSVNYEEGFSCQNIQDIPQVECEALEALYNATNGENWTENTNWFVTETACDWFGITCDELTPGDWQVYEIFLESNQLSGPIPPELGSLAELRILNMVSNELSGDIPIQLWNLPNLVDLNLFGNLLTGSIPDQFDGLTNLEHLNLGRNLLDGTIPGKLAELTNLRTLSLWNNKLSGEIPPWIGDFQYLEKLHLGHNPLTGQIPAELGRLANLQELELSEIYVTGGPGITGPIPKELGDLTNLRWLSLMESYGISGSIPKELGKLANLEELYLGSLRLTGSIPGELGDMTRLKYLELSRNKLDGLIPPQIGQLTNLVALCLDNNALEGEIPETITDLANLNPDESFCDPVGIDLGYNKLISTNALVRDFLSQKDPDWEATQTIPPKNLQATVLSPDIVRLTWTPIPYIGDYGYYQVSYSTDDGASWSIHGETQDKTVDEYLVDGLEPGTYLFRVQTYTPPHAFEGQQNELWSEYSQEVLADTYQVLTYPLVEEFDPALPFISTTPGQVYIQGGKVIWNLTQTVSMDQYIFRSIPYFEGDYRLSVYGQINNHGGNHNVEIGVSDEYGVGPNINFGFFGGSLGLPHCPNSGYYIGARGVNLIPDETTGCDTVPISSGTPYLVTMTVRNGVMDLVVEGVGTAHGTTTYTGPFDMLWIGQEGGSDSPWAAGTIDYVIIEPLGNDQSAPILQSPVDQSVIYLPDQPAYQWLNTPDANWYLLKVSSVSDFSDGILIDEWVNENEYTYGETFGEGIYYWKVYPAIIGSNIGQWSQIWSFEITYPDTDGDGFKDNVDNAPDEYNPDQSDIDNDGVGDVVDPCPSDPTDTCDPNGSAGASIGTEGGSLSPPDGNSQVDIPAGSLDEETSISITDTGTGFVLDTDIGEATAVIGIEIGPPGTVFNEPVTVEMSWPDVDNDGIVDTTAEREINLFIFKDGVAITEKCNQDPGCDMVNNTFSVEVSSLSHFTLATPINTPPTADIGGPYQTNEGEAITLDASLSSDLENNIVAYEWDLDNDGAYDDATGVTVDLTFWDNGNYLVGLRVTDLYEEIDTDSISVTVINLAPVVTVDIASQVVQYSDYIDQVNFTGTDVLGDAMSYTMTGTPSGLTVTLQGCIGDGNYHTCTWILSGAVSGQAGSYDIQFDVNDDVPESTTGNTSILVEPEDASIAYDSDNLIAVKVESPGGTSPTFKLVFYASETVPDQALYAAAPGDISLANLSVTLQPVGPGTPVPGICSPLSTSGTGYDGVQSFTCEFSAAAVNTYMVDASVIGGYFVGHNEDVVVVFDPSLGFTTGGGWFYWPGSADVETGYSGNKTNFGYTMKYNKKGERVKGNLLLIRHMPDGSIYRIKSNALYGLALGEGDGYGWASFSGKATYLEPGWSDPIGNHKFLVYVEDRNELGVKVDQFWIEIRDKDGVVITKMSFDREAIYNTVELNGGNIVVPH